MSAAAVTATSVSSDGRRGRPAADIVEGLLRVKTDVKLAARLSAGASSTVRERFSWGAIERETADWLDRLEPAT